MGQYWYPVNLDRKEFVKPHKLGAGLKLWEQLAGHPGTGGALVILTAAMPEDRGGGDFRSINLEGDDGEITRRTIGRWAGDRIALIGDYAEDGDIFACAKRTGSRKADIPTVPTPPILLMKESTIYNLCPYDETEAKDGSYTDISDDVARVIELELEGKFTGDGWREFVRDKGEWELREEAERRELIAAATNLATSGLPLDEGQRHSLKLMATRLAVGM